MAHDFPSRNPAHPRGLPLRHRQTRTGADGNQRASAGDPPGGGKVLGVAASAAAGSTTRHAAVLVRTWSISDPIADEVLHEASQGYGAAVGTRFRGYPVDRRFLARAAVVRSVGSAWRLSPLAGRTFLAGSGSRAAAVSRPSVAAGQPRTPVVDPVPRLAAAGDGYVCSRCARGIVGGSKAGRAE